jgi:hypothetical protein
MKSFVIAMLCAVLCAVAAPVRAEKVVDTKFVLACVALEASSIYDMERTLYRINHCPAGYDCQEANPIMKPFVKRGRMPMYLAQTVLNGASMVGAYHLKKGGHREWVIIPSFGVGVHGVFGTFTFRF